MARGSLRIDVGAAPKVGKTSIDIAVFRPFQRLGDGGRATYDGIGLGLAVTKGFVEAMGGEITVEDTPGGGTTIVITLGVAT